jgi:signal recognition particle subunit SRP54
MTPAERDDPKILNGSRRARIAKGAGVEVSAVNNLVNRFFDARKMMSAVAGGKMPNIPGMPGMGGGAGGGTARKAKQQKKKGKGKKVSGNPAKRNAPQQPDAPAANGSAFGAPTDQDLAQSMKDFELPPELKKMLDQNK